MNRNVATVMGRYRQGHRSLGSARALASLACAAGSIFAWADQAVVVGVQEYAPLISASTLRGCVNDAVAIKGVLEGMKFKVILLTDAQATKKGILGAIADVGKSMKRIERFVFYFAGHGRRLPHPALMPHDATADGNDLTTNELNSAILKFPARSRTVILDACFSGGMAAGEMARGVVNDPLDLSARYWEPPAAQERSLNFGPVKTAANNQDHNAGLENGTGVCYYTACTSSEQALEGSFAGQRHGVFTNSLLQYLEGDQKPWGEVHGSVKNDIRQKLEKHGRQQNPTISKDYMNALAFTNDVKKPVPPKPTKSLIDIWNLDNADPKKLLLEFQPNENVYEVGRKISMTIQIGQEGYLVVLGQVDGHYYQFWPQGRATASDAQVKPGKMSFPPPGQMLFFDAFGADQVKAILLPTPEKAQQVLDAMRAVQGQTSDQVSQKDLIMTRSLNEPEYTSRVTIALADNLIGGARFKNLDNLIRKVGLRADPASQWLWEKMIQPANSDYPGAMKWVAEVDFNAPIDTRTRQQFVTLLNLAAQDYLLHDEAAFAEVKLSRQTLDLLKKHPEGNERIKLNRMILADTYPDEVFREDERAKPVSER